MDSRDSRQYSLWDLKGLWPYLRPEARVLFGCLGLMLISTAVQIARPFCLKLIVDEAVAKSDLVLMGQVAAAFLLLLLIGATTTYVQSVRLAEAGIRIVNRMKQALFSHVLNLPIHWFAAHNSGWVVSRIESDTEELKQFCSRFSLKLFTDALTFFGILVTMYWAAPEIALNVLPVLIGIILLIFFFFGRIRARFDAARSAYADLSGFLGEHLSAVFLIQLYDQGDAVMKTMESKSVQRKKTELTASLFSYGFWSLFLFVTEGVMLGLLVYFGASQVLKAEMSLGTLIMLIEFARQMVRPLSALGENIAQLQRSAVSARRILQILEKEPEETEPRSQAPDFEKLSFENVSFAYEENQNVLQGVSFTLPRGMRMALVGSSGSGKSTTIQLICRFLKPSHGHILFNGVDVSELSLESYRSKIGLVLQDIHLFAATVMQNLKAMDESISDEQVVAAAKSLGAHGFISDLPHGYDTWLSERGANLSMGQRQLLSFVRAMVRNPQILVLDEATASLDPGTERSLQRALEVLLEGRTAVVIAHRLSTIRHCDCILVMESGAILERGNHEQLMQKQGRYFELVGLQSGGSAE